MSTKQILHFTEAEVYEIAQSLLSKFKKKIAHQRALENSKYMEESNFTHRASFWRKVAKKIQHTNKER